MVSIPITLRVHAIGCAFPMCDKPQALDIGIDGESGEMFVYRVSGEKRTLLDIGRALTIWSRWLPVVWGIRPIVNGSAIGPNGKSLNWSCVREGGLILTLNTPNLGPPVAIATSELEAALLVMGGPAVLQGASNEEFPEHPLRDDGFRVVRHNHRIHEIAQEVEEIDL